MIYNNNFSDDQIIENIRAEVYNISTKDKYTIIHDAILTERCELLEYLLERDCFVYSVDNEYSVYELCVLRQNFKAFEILNNYRPLSEFASDRSLNIAVMLNLPLRHIKRIISFVSDINLIDNRNMTCVDWAIQHCNVSTLLFLLENDAKIQHIEDTQYCLYTAVGDSNFEAVEMLISYGADVNGFDEVPLSLAIYNGVYEMAILLLTNGANINQRDVYGKTEAHYSAIRNDKVALFFLQQNGANFDILDNEGITPKDILDNSKLREKLYNEWYG